MSNRSWTTNSVMMFAQPGCPDGLSARSAAWPARRRDPVGDRSHSGRRAVQRGQTVVGDRDANEQGVAHRAPAQRPMPGAQRTNGAAHRGGVAHRGAHFVDRASDHRLGGCRDAREVEHPTGTVVFGFSAAKHGEIRRVGAGHVLHQPFRIAHAHAMRRAQQVGTRHRGEPFVWSDYSITMQSQKWSVNSKIHSCEYRP